MQGANSSEVPTSQDAVVDVVNVVVDVFVAVIALFLLLFRTLC